MNLRTSLFTAQNRMPARGATAAALLAGLQLTALVGAALISLSTTGSADAAEAASSRAVTARNCGVLSRINTVHSTDGQTGTSAQFAPVALSLVNFTVTGTTNSCVIVSFSAQAYAGFGGLMWVRAVLDGRQSVDGQVAFVAESEAFGDSHSYSFLFPSVPPGNHSVHMQYRSQFAGSAVAIDKFSVEVQHR